MAVLAPMPSASVSITAAANPGARRSARSAVLDVAADIVEPGKRARIALAVLHLLYAAERTSGRDARIGRAHAAAPIVVFQQRQVCRGLARQIGLGPVRPEDID